MDEDSYTKEQTKSAKFVSLVHAVSMGTPAAKAAAVAAQHALAPNRLASAASVSTLDGLETEQDSLQVRCHGLLHQSQFCSSQLCGVIYVQQARVGVDVWPQHCALSLRATCMTACRSMGCYLLAA